MDYTLINGTIVDGTGSPGYRADLAIQGQTIAAIAPSLPHRGQVIDARDQIVCPGFIDMHSHSGLMWLAEPRLEPKIHQGITTEVPGVDGYSAAPIQPQELPSWRTHLSGLDGNPAGDWPWSSFGEYMERLKGTSVNWAPLVGHGNLRLAVMGMANRQATQRELAQMCDLLDTCFQEGAFGLSTGLVYTPQAYCNLEEMVALGRVVARYDSFFDFHMRTEGEHIHQSVDEVLEVGRQSGCAIHICHFKLGARPVWGRLEEVVSLIESARRSGVEVTCDQYPYTAGSTMAAALMPPWAHEGGPERLRRRLQSREEWSRLERDALEGIAPVWESRFKNRGPENILISSVKTEGNRPFVGKSLKEIGERWAVSPFEAAVRLLLEEDFEVGMVGFWGLESDVEAIMQLPWHMFCTDGLLGGTPHPRVYGTYPRILGHYVRGRGVLTVEEAVKKCTSVPAARLRLKDRGVLAPGKIADVTVFDPATVIDRSTYPEPRQLPAGIHQVFVNGRMVVSGGQHTGAMPGRSL